MSPDDLTRAELEALGGVSRRTVNRWRSRGAIPEPYFTMLALRLGTLDAMDPAWREWRLTRGRIWSPEGHGFTPGELRALPHLLELAATIEAERRRPAQYVLL